jgi:hypothetical protein
VPVSVMIPVEALDLESSGGIWVVEGQLSMGSLDHRGGRSDMPVIPLRLKLREEPKRGGLARYRTTLKLRRIQQRVVFRFSNSKTGALLWKELELGPEGAS